MAGSFVIGIAGGTGSGKTTVAGRIARDLGTGRVVTVVQDNYYRDWSHLPPQERDRVNFDHPSAIDAALMGAHVGALKRGQAIDMPTYDFRTHTRTDRTVRVEPAEILIVEGILVLELEETRSLMDVKLYVETDDDLRFIRRLRRDVEERGRSVSSVIDQYLETVRPMHREFVEKSRRNADIILPWDERNEAAVGMVTRMLRGFVELDGDG
ncbi:MAG: uridine kinase [Myxococcales bacterium]